MTPKNVMAVAVRHAVKKDSLDFLTGIEEEYDLEISASTTYPQAPD